MTRLIWTFAPSPQDRIGYPGEKRTMSLNHIELPGFIVADWYKKSLLGEISTSRAKPVTPDAEYKYLGKNKKHTVILVDYPNEVFLPETELAFLSKILEACKMNMADVAIVNHASSPVVIGALKKQLNPRILLLFGLGPMDIRLPIDFPRFKIQAYDGCSYIAGPSLGEVNQETEEGKVNKVKLWTCFKQVFEI